VFYWFLCRSGPVRACHIFKAVAAPLWATLCVFLGLLGLRAVVHIPSAAFTLVSGSFLTVLLTPVALLFFPGGKRLLADFLEIASCLMKRPSAPMSADIVGVMD
jgi:hypothetical protein